MKINGTTYINNWGDTNYDITVNINLIQGQLYELIVEWKENNGGAEYILSWQYPGISQELVQLVPNWHSYEHSFSTSPTSVTVLPQLWGNGFIDNSEQWDDGNLINGDGWNFECLNEFCSDGIVNN